MPSTHSPSFSGGDLKHTAAVGLVGGLFIFLLSSSEGFQASHVSTKLGLVVGYFLLIAAALFTSCPPIPQDQEYHNFADKRCLCCVPNTLDVLSNLPFALVAAIGLGQIFLWNGDLMIEHDKLQKIAGYDIETNLIVPVFSKPKEEQLLWGAYFLGVGLVSFGSSYYHLKPNDERLVWDRIPMTISFMSLLALIVSESFNISISPLGLTVLISFGVGTVMYWHLYNDLRPYILVQFGSLLAIPISLVVSSQTGGARYQGTGQHYAIALSFYGAAKVAEVYDHQIFYLTRGTVSGHSLKHLLSGVATAWAIVILAARELNETGSPFDANDYTTKVADMMDQTDL